MNQFPNSPPTCQDPKRQPDTKSPPDFDALPEATRARPQWLRWCAVPGGHDKPDKVPFQANGKKARSTDPRTWATFEAARKSYREAGGGQGGLGFVPLPEDGLTVIDLDNCRDSGTGAVAEWASKIVRDFDTYTEVSPSGTGLHLIARGRKPGRRSSAPHNGGKVELFDGETEDGTPGGRFVAMTGWRTLGTPATINDRQPQIDAVYRLLFGDPGPARPDAPPERPPPETAPVPEQPPPDWPEALGPLLEACATAPKGERSERDFRLCAVADRLKVPAEAVWERVKSVGKFAEKGRRYFERTWRRAHADNEAPPLPRVIIGGKTLTPPPAAATPGTGEYECQHLRGDILDDGSRVHGRLTRCLCAWKCAGCRNYVAYQAAAHFAWAFEQVAGQGACFRVLPNVCPTDRRAWARVTSAVRKIEGYSVQPLGGRMIVVHEAGAALPKALAGAPLISQDEATAIMKADFARAAPARYRQQIGNWSQGWAIRRRKKERPPAGAKKKRWVGKLATLDAAQNARLLAQLRVGYTTHTTGPTRVAGCFDRTVSVLRTQELADAAARSRVIHALKEGSVPNGWCAHKPFSVSGGGAGAHGGHAPSDKTYHNTG
jgi:hypothetical protein